MSELDPERVGEAVVAGQLPAVIDLDSVARERKRVERAPVAGGVRHLDLGGPDCKAGGIEIDAIELAGELDQRAVAIGGDRRR